MKASRTVDLHGEVGSAESDMRAFMKGSPDLADPATHAEYLPLKRRLDDALEALGRAAKI